MSRTLTRPPTTKRTSSEDGITLVGDAVGNLPWQARPANSNELVWRYSANPIIDRHPIPVAYSIYNSAVIPFRGRYAGVFRAEYKTRMPYLHVGFSEDGIKWDIHHEKLPFEGEYAYDP